jgi:hypothetical protein
VESAPPTRRLDQVVRVIPALFAPRRTRPMTRTSRLQGLRPATVDRIVYTTITMMSVLIVYDGWHRLRIIDVIGVIVGPVLAMFISHVFSASMARQMESEAALTAGQRLAIVGAELPFLLFCVPPLALLLIQYLMGVSLTDAIRVTLWLGALSLGGWGFVVGRRSHSRGWSLAVSTVAGLFVGMVVLLLQVFLQPGALVTG